MLQVKMIVNQNISECYAVFSCLKLFCGFDKNKYRSTLKLNGGK